MSGTNLLLGSTHTLLASYKLLLSLHRCLRSYWQSCVRLAQSSFGSLLNDFIGPSVSKFLLSSTPWVIDNTSDHKWTEWCWTQSFGTTGCCLPPCNNFRYNIMILGCGRSSRNLGSLLFHSVGLASYTLSKISFQTRHFCGHCHL